MKPKMMRTQSAPKRYGIQLVKSYLVWQAKSVRAMKMAKVKMSAWSTILDSNMLVTTETLYASSAVKAVRKARFIGWTAC
jgi:hypothetical protein